jgi:hypothetical protein
MLSILIPIYNYNAYPLVKRITDSCLEAKIDFEILCRDDFLLTNKKSKIWLSFFEK